MFTLRFTDSELQKQIENPHKFYAEEICNELQPYLDGLIQNGEIAGSDFYSGRINRIKGHTFSLHYKSNIDDKTIFIIKLDIHCMTVFREQFSLIDSWDDDQVLDRIPQYDVPTKLIQALMIINQDVVTSLELGRQLGHKAKKTRDVARHGQYAQQALSELKLISRVRAGRFLRPELTPAGRCIANAPDKETQAVLVIQAMLNYRPVRKILEAIDDGREELSEAVVKNIVFLKAEHSSDTSNRRAHTMKTWVKWMCTYQLIPIRCKGPDLQLTLFQERVE
jgi:hypothetical protein